VNQTVVNLLIGVIPLVTAGALFVLGLGAKYLAERRKQSLLMAALFALDGIVADVVKELNQTVVADLKAQSADGKLTPEEAVQIKNKAIDLILARLKAGTIQILQAMFGSIVDLIGSKIEAAVWDSNRTAPGGQAA